MNTSIIELSINDIKNKAKQLARKNIEVSIAIVNSKKQIIVSQPIFNDKNIDKNTDHIIELFQAITIYKQSKENTLTEKQNAFITKISGDNGYLNNKITLELHSKTVYASLD